MIRTLKWKLSVICDIIFKNRHFIIINMTTSDLENLLSDGGLRCNVKHCNLNRYAVNCLFIRLGEGVDLLSHKLEGLEIEDLLTDDS